ncbi:MAG: universal stress protein [Desulfobacter sp.]|nr:MAG: universal stress protein [Desulfobacter sp.]
MKEIKTVMACIDLSDYSPMTLGYALGLARQAGLKASICSVVHHRDVHPVYIAGMISPGRVDTEEQVTELREYQEAEVHALVRTLFPEFAGEVDIRIDTGYPAEQILAAVDDLKPGLVVMANKGRSNFSRFMFGSAAERVFRHCRVPLLSVRDRTVFRRMYTGSEKPVSREIRTVLAAVDFSPWSGEILSQAGWLARAAGARLHVFNCISRRELDWIKTHYTPEDNFSEAEFLPGEKDRRLSHLEGLAQTAGIRDLPGFDISLDSGIPFERIMAAAENLEADVLVLGPRGRNRSARFAMGSTMEKIFRHCPVPVLRLGPDING